MHSIINPCTGIRIAVHKGQKIEITDIKGGQVVDFFAEMQCDDAEFLSPGVTIDCNASLRIRVGDLLYSNKYRPMLRVLYDDVGEHDLLHPCCRPEMYDFFYHNGKGHPNCLDNINKALGKTRPILIPLIYSCTQGSTQTEASKCASLYPKQTIKLSLKHWRIWTWESPRAVFLKAPATAEPVPPLRSR